MRNKNEAAIEAEPEATAITFTNDEWCQIHMAVLDRRSWLRGAKNYDLELADSMTGLADKIIKETRNFYGVE